MRDIVAVGIKAGEEEDRDEDEEEEKEFHDRLHLVELGTAGKGGKKHKSGYG